MRIGRRPADLGPRNGGRALARRARELAAEGKERRASVRAFTAYELLTEDLPTRDAFATADAFEDCAAAFTTLGNHGMAFRCLSSAIEVMGRLREAEPENGLAHVRFGVLGFAAYTSAVAGGREPAALVDVLEFTVRALTTGPEPGRAEPDTLIEAAKALADRYDEGNRPDEAAAVRRVAEGMAESD
ncbi:hypothetical protein [Embleya scabrispora]|uniref:hypothetical protein n=1 Tax=Embleya scabrispora TaxID=159449 RepID=UPI00036A62F2|nr:hypothetical protein [Embleya scabrispora]MYS84966.1 hypothetical protein [Streptomyces sp. SID5474]